VTAYVPVVGGVAAPAEQKGGKTTLHRDIVMMDDFLYGEPQPIQ